MFFEAKFADLCIAIDCKYQSTEKFCGSYVSKNTEAKCDLKKKDSEALMKEAFSVSTTPEEIQAENQNVSEMLYSMNYLETLVVLRKIAERIPKYDRFLMHGATISFEGKAYMFTALSGTGKSTHIKLWKRYLGKKVQIVNGDKPFIWVKDENKVQVYGSPWAGKENWHRNTSAPLEGICFLKRGSKNRVRRIEARDSPSLLFKQVYMPTNAAAAGKTLELLDAMLKTVPLYILECDISEGAVKTSFEALTGLSYEDYKEKEECEEVFDAD